MTKRIPGELEIDAERGVIYFHSAETGVTMLRICQLPTPIPNQPLDLTHMYGQNWLGKPGFLAAAGFAQQPKTNLLVPRQAPSAKTRQAK